MAEPKSGPFPYIPEVNWWTLRRKFKESVPPSVNARYVAHVIDVAEESARKTTMPALRIIGIIGEADKTTDLAYKWRDDNQYPQVCEEIVNRVYPQELRDLYSAPDSDPNKVKSWFMNEARVGDNAASKFARFYLLLLDKNPERAGAGTQSKATKVPTGDGNRTQTRPKATTGTKKQPAGKTTKAQPDSEGQPTSDAVEKPVTPPPTPELPPVSMGKGMSLHIDIQIHISPEVSPAQIDQIFESMAKHLPMSR